jgi:TIR domain
MPIERSEPASFEFDFAISFAGPERGSAEQLAQALTARGAAVFYDASYRAQLLGKRMDTEFAWVFGPATRYFVPFVSHSYVERGWPQLEWDVARREADSRRDEFVLPIRCDDTLLFGLPETINYLDLRELSLDEMADVLVEKLKAVPVAGAFATRDWVAAFGLVVGDAHETGEVADDAPRDYAHLCDWLINNLLVELRDAPIANPGVVGDARDGETLAVRVRFEWDPTMGPLKFGSIAPWDVLEVLPFEEVYPE